ncbi:MAG: HU family DNA-binding protein [Candidatus Hatepunaea meridiana]|nr:HU family DNA-binding protein [Candidatus Hatepunaea meridiana]
MNRADIIENISKKTGLTRTDVSAVFEGILKMIESELSEGGTVELRRFGTFKCVKRAARRAVNPRTGEPVDVAERVVPAFKSSPQLRKAVADVKL